MELFMHTLLRTLLAAYGPQHWWPAQSVEEMMVGAILVQNTAWTQVARVIANLQAHQMLSMAAIRSGQEELLWRLLRPVGFFRVKARRLKALAECMARFGDQPERLFQLETDALRNTLLRVHGIGKETADAIVCYGAHRPLFVVDAYTRRLFQRLGWITARASYDEIQDKVQQALPREVQPLAELHALIVQHAKCHCRARPLCGHCPLTFCPHYEKVEP
ncbi:MAG: endonuclease [Magnetococcales bacterium]|nr:endonuclease [Magnetococcales bacterium]